MRLDRREKAGAEEQDEGGAALAAAEEAVEAGEAEGAGTATGVIEAVAENAAGSHSISVKNKGLYSGVRLRRAPFFCLFCLLIVPAIPFARRQIGHTPPECITSHQKKAYDRTVLT